MTVDQGFRDKNIFRSEFHWADTQIKYKPPIVTTSKSLIVICSLNFSIFVYIFQYLYTNFTFSISPRSCRDSISLAYSCFIPSSLIYCHCSQAKQHLNLYLWLLRWLGSSQRNYIILLYDFFAYVYTSTFLLVNYQSVLENYLCIYIHIEIFVLVNNQFFVSALWSHHIYIYILYNNKIVFGELPIRFGKLFVYLLLFQWITKFV